MTNKEIKELINDFTGLDIASKNRDLKYIDARAIYYKMCHKHSSEKVTLESIGREINISHATVLNGLKVFNDLSSTDIKFLRLSKEIEDLIISKTPKKEVYFNNIIDNQKTNRIRRRLKNSKIEIKELKNEIKKLKKQDEILRNKIKKVALQ